MKALGLVVCMARAGLPVPCNPPAALPAFSTVLADIGDEQSLSASLSTFSSHLTHIQVGPRCFVEQAVCGAVLQQAIAKSVADCVTAGADQTRRRCAQRLTGAH